VILDSCERRFLARQGLQGLGTWQQFWGSRINRLIRLADGVCGCAETVRTRWLNIVLCGAGVVFRVIEAEVSADGSSSCLSIDNHQRTSCRLVSPLLMGGPRPLCLLSHAQLRSVEQGLRRDHPFLQHGPQWPHPVAPPTLLCLEHPWDNCIESHLPSQNRDGRLCHPHLALSECDGCPG
jgi:hypothetical protein